MKRDQITFDLTNAQYTNHTDVDISLNAIETQLFENTRPAAGRMQELSEVTDIEKYNYPLSVSSVELREKDGYLSIELRIPELTVQLLATDGDHPLLVFNQVQVPKYDHYYIALLN